MCEGLLGAHGNTVDRQYHGRDLRFCRDQCRVRFEGDGASGSAEVDRRMIADQLPLYPLRTSVVSGSTLGENPVDFIVGNRLFRVSTADEQKQVLADSDRYFKILDHAVIQAQRPHYGMPTKCPVQGDILADDVPIDFVVANRMIRVCCTRCVRVVKSRPSQYLSMIDYANREAGAQHRAQEVAD